MSRLNSKRIQLVEVGPRDGLQNETVVLDLSTRLSLASKLASSGVRRIELGAFVHPDWVPQMAGSGQLIKKALQYKKQGKINKSANFSALVPNMRGLEAAIEAGAKDIAVFAASSESFSQKNINCSINESFKRFEPVFELAQKKNIKVRGYLSTCFGCPYEGAVSVSKVVRYAERLIDMGAYEVSISDTIGVATPKQVNKVLEKVLNKIDVENVAMHFHDTRGTALANISASLSYGVAVFDTSIGGLGGCPYAPGASGNVATEDVVYMLHGMGYKTGVDLDSLIKVSHWLSSKMQRSLPSKVSAAGNYKA